MMSSNPEPAENDTKTYGRLSQNAPPISDLYERGDGYKVIIVKQNRLDENLFKDQLLQDIRDVKYREAEAKTKAYVQINSSAKIKMKAKDICKMIEKENMKR